MNPNKVSQIDAMRMGVNYSQTISCRNFSVSVRPLSMSETLKVYDAVAMEFAKMPATAKNSVKEHTLIARETLKAASTSAIGVFDPKITDPMLDAMTQDEVGFLYKQYVHAMDKCNPSLELMEPKDLEALVEELKKKTGADLAWELTQLSLVQLASLARYYLTSNQKGD